MARPSLSEEARDAFRRRLCTLARRRFAEEGYAAVTLRALARELGVSHAMTYRYFAGKDELFAAVRRQCLQDFTAYQEARLRAAGEPRAAIREGARSYLDFALEQPEAFRVVFELGQPDLRGHPELRREHRRAFRVLEGVMRRARAAGVVEGDPAELAHLFWAAVHGVAALHLARPLTSRRAAHALAGKLTNTLLVGLAPKTRRPRGRVE